MKMFHINDKGEIKKCQADLGRCRFFKGNDDSRHFPSVETAEQYMEKKLEKEAGDDRLTKGTVDTPAPETESAPETTQDTPETTPEDTSETTENDSGLLVDENDDGGTEVQYSFMKRFRHQEREFNETFKGVPNRFANANIGYDDIEKQREALEEAYGDVMDEYSEKGRLATYISSKNADKALNSMLVRASAPADFTATDSEDYCVEAMERLGITDIKDATDLSLAGVFKDATVAWAGEYNGSLIVVPNSNVSPSTCGTYRLRGIARPEWMGEHRSFKIVNSRKIAGADRILSMTGNNVLSAHTGSFAPEELEGYNHDVDNVTPRSLKDARDNDREPYLSHASIRDENLKERVIKRHSQDMQKKYMAVKTAYALRESQETMDNFKAQQKFINESSGSIATVWMNKKHPDEEHQKMMKNSTLRKDFADIEYDNAVDPKHADDFERSFHAVKDKLPKIPAKMQPTLKVRFLGKHKATGLFSPAHNTLAIDVRDSGSFIHEYGHALDTVVKSNHSLNKEFSGIAREYRKNLKTPPGMDSKAEYYGMNTEVHSRAFEVYAHERLGIKNSRLLNEGKFNNFDYAPITSNPELKKKAFDFFDKAFADLK